MLVLLLLFGNLNAEKIECNQHKDIMINKKIEFYQETIKSTIIQPEFSKIEEVTTELGKFSEDLNKWNTLVQEEKIRDQSLVAQIRLPTELRNSPTIFTNRLPFKRTKDIWSFCEEVGLENYSTQGTGITKELTQFLMKKSCQHLRRDQAYALPCYRHLPDRISVANCLEKDPIRHQLLKKEQYWPEDDLLELKLCKNAVDFRLDCSKTLCIHTQW